MRNRKLLIFLTAINRCRMSDISSRWFVDVFIPLANDLQTLFTSHSVGWERKLCNFSFFSSRLQTLHKFAMDTIECGPFLMDPTPFMRVQFIHLFSELGGKKDKREHQIWLSLYSWKSNATWAFCFAFLCRVGKFLPKKKLPLDINLIHFWFQMAATSRWSIQHAQEFHPAWNNFHDTFR